MRSTSMAERQKPVQLEAFESLVKSINDFWLTKVKLPQKVQVG
jgi:hypothetical protein